ncbi:UDP-2,3-diacylglucosamine diphosphatase [Candidatus Spongiihabitans sp.]|uniref:UDP-2,3-diacylglucosamine diphosphatase n=1 Tax=Candidatus Spongiihabitans sp. TaxID=3101308 RepID=UPI003C7A27BD
MPAPDELEKNITHDDAHTMTIAFISDLHLDPVRPESTQWFKEFMSHSIDRLSRLYILGDLFEVWIGDDGRDTLGQGAVENIIKATVHAGLDIFFMHGNRDFLVGNDFAKRTGCKILPDPTLITLDSKQVLLTHGDALCTDDIEHQTARQEMLTAKWKMAFLNKPVNQRMDTARSMRTQSETSKKTKSMAMMDVNQQQVEKVMREHGVLTMIHGHTHKPAVHEFSLDGAPAKRYVLGDWYTQKSVLYYDHGGFALRG